MNTDGDQISMIAEITTEPEGDEVLKMEFDKEFPVMPLRNMVMFPHVVMVAHKLGSVLVRLPAESLGQ